MGSGFRDFATNEVLTSANVNNYLMTQAVMSFSSTTTRDSALSGSLAEGMVAYTRDTNSMWWYDNTDWQALFTGWSTFTPSWTGLTVGSATQTARWRIESGCMRISLLITLAADSAIDSSSTYFTIPALSSWTPSGGANYPVIGNVVAKDGTTDETGHAFVNSAGTAVLVYCGGNDITTTNPFTWTTGDQIYVDISIPVDAA